MSIGVVWDSERPSLKHIMSVFATLGTSLKLRDVFQSVVDDRWAQMTQHQLVGVVTYYGKHYSTFFFHTKLRVWIYFDDATVREIGPHWDQVVEKCRRGHFQPLLLLYADPNGSSVPVDSAPKLITRVSTQPEPSGAGKPAADSAPTLTRRAVTPNPEKSDATAASAPRRAITPNPDLGHSGAPDEAFEGGSASNYKRQIEAIKKTGGILPNKPNILSRPRVDVEEAAKGRADRPRTISGGGYLNTRGNRNSSSSLEQFDKEPLRLPESANVPRRRDSGNWSGDRNSASSSSSTSLENPYPFLVGKSGRHSNPSSPSGKQPPSLRQHPEYANLGIGVNAQNPSQQPQPQPQQTQKRQHPDQPNGNYDPGYDSYSLSSNEAFPLQQSLKHNLQVSLNTFSSCVRTTVF